MRCPRVVPWLASVTIAFALIGSAHAEDRADPPPGAELITRGEALAEKQQFADALRVFKQAVELSPSPLHHCYVALTYFKLKRYPEARLALDRAFDAGRDHAPKWCSARLADDLSRALRVGSFAEVDLSSQPRGATVSVSSLDPDERITTPRRIWLAFGAHRLQVSHPGYQSQEVDIEVTSKQLMPVDIALVASDVAGAEPPPAPEPTPLPTVAPRPATDDREVGRRGRTWGWVSLSAGALAVAAGGYFHASALSTKRDAEKLYEGADFDDRLSTFERERAIAISGYAVGAIGVGVGLYLLLRGDRHPARRQVSIDVTGDRIAVSLSGSL